MNSIRLLGLTFALASALALAQGEPSSPAPTPPAVPSSPGAPTEPPAEPTAPSSPTPDLPEPPAVPDAGETDLRSSLELKRNDKTIKVIKTSLDENTGFAITCGVGGDSEVQKSIYFDTSPGGVQVLIDQNQINAPLSVMFQNESGDGRVELSGGTATYNEVTGDCPQTNPVQQPGVVRVVQGKTNLSGSSLVYDETDGLARIAGPIQFARPDPQNPIQGSSDDIVVDVDNSITTLVGNVRLTSGRRVSTALEMEYDDAKSRAILKGTCGKPATSAEGNEPGLRATRLVYHLDTGDVVVGKDAQCIVTGEFRIE